MAAKISKEAVKALVKKYAKAGITDDAAEEMARMLSQKAASIASFAVKSAGKENRRMITKKDISDYAVMFGD